MTSIDFKTMLLQHNDALRGFAYNLTRDRDDALDLVQDTFLKALNYKDSFSEKSNFKAWLLTIMKNTFINAYNRSIKGRSIMTEIINTQTIHYNNAETTSSVADINKAINKLKDEYKIPLLRFIEGFKYNEIADELHLPIGTVKSRIFTARAKVSGVIAGNHKQQTV
jgi:RNA polymerase sigma-70 factor (ECF subfamily)